MGRIKASSQVVAGTSPYQFSYSYDISGALATETYPSGRIVTNSFDAAGRIAWHPCPRHFTRLTDGQRSTLEYFIDLMRRVGLPM